MGVRIDREERRTFPHFKKSSSNLMTGDCKSFLKISFKSRPQRGFCVSVSSASEEV